jgi:hypothetical protein
MKLRATTAALGLAALVSAAAVYAQDSAAFTSIFNGKDLTGWKVPEGDNGHWKVVDGVIDCDAQSEAKVPDKSLWTEKKYKDFVLKLEWRLKDAPYMNSRVPIIKADGTHKKDAAGKEYTITVPDGDSGIYLRGEPKSQVNIWNWPCGSGEVYGYRMDAKQPAKVRRRMDAKQPAKVRRDVTPKVNADKDIGQWNAFEITMKGDVLNVKLNGRTVLKDAQLPGIPAEGPIGLQHHGGKNAKGEWTAAPSLVQFRNVQIREL